MTGVGSGITTRIHQKFTVLIVTVFSTFSGKTGYLYFYSKEQLDQKNAKQNQNNNNKKKQTEKRGN